VFKAKSITKLSVSSSFTSLYPKRRKEDAIYYRRLVFLGPPGAGKGTAASWVAKQLRVSHISIGKIFRHEITIESPIGKLANIFISQGQLVSDEIVMKIVDQWLLHHEREGFVFDGFPRTLSQARLFQDLLKKHSMNLDAVIYLKVSQTKAEERILGRLVCEKCGENFHLQNRPPKREGICDRCDAKLVRRDDDHQEMLEKRWAVFKEQTAGLIEFYRESGLLFEVDADMGIEEMCRQTWEVIAP